MDTLNWLNQLIRFNTISSNSNLHLIEFIDDWFKQHKLLSYLIPSPNDELKANLFATLPGKNGETQGGLLLSGHTDVVDVAGQDWKTDPFIATHIDGKVYGRGACDMKGFIAVLLALIPEFKRLQLSKPIHFSLTYDEEVGCIGAEYLVEFLKQTGIQPEGCVVGEPSSLRPIIGEKARQVYHGQVHGREAHSSLVVSGCNAIEYACRLIWYIHKLANYLKKNGSLDYDYDCPFTTVTTNVISGGIAANIIPGSCEFILEIRYLPEFPKLNFYQQIKRYIKAELLPDMRKNYPEAAVYLDEISDEPGFSASEDALITRVVRSVTGVNQRLKVSYSTEAGFFQDAHIPTIICGPGDIEQAHRPNEYVTIKQLKLCEHVLQNVAHLFCGNLSS